MLSPTNAPGLLSKLSADSYGIRLQVSKSAVMITFLQKVYDECCELVLLSSSEISSATYLPTFSWMSQSFNFGFGVHNFQLTGEINGDNISTATHDLYQHLNNFHESISIQCRKSLLLDLFQAGETDQRNLSNDLIKLLCSVVLGSLKSRLGDKCDIQCFSGERDSFNFSICESNLQGRVPAYWLIFDVRKSNDFKIALNSQLTDLKTTGENKAYVFVAFNELQVSLRRNKGSDTLPTLNAVMISVGYHDSQPRLTVVTFDREPSEFYYSYSVDGAEKIRARDHYKQDEILNALVDGYISTGLSCDLTVICVPCRSSLSFYELHHQSKEVLDDKLVEQLCELAAEGNPSELRKWSQSGVNTPCPKYRNRTPLLCAAAAATFRPFGKASQDHTDCAMELISRGADMRVKDSKGLSVLHCAVNSDNHTLLKLLLKEKSTDCNWQSSDDWTPLMIAARSDDAEAAELLLRAGADANIRNCDGDTAEDICKKMGCEKVKNVFQAVRASSPSTHEAANFQPATKHTTQQQQTKNHSVRWIRRQDTDADRVGGAGVSQQAIDETPSSRLSSPVGRLQREHVLSGTEEKARSFKAKIGSVASTDSIWKSRRSFASVMYSDHSQFVADSQQRKTKIMEFCQKMLYQMHQIAQETKKTEEEISLQLGKWPKEFEIIEQSDPRIILQEAKRKLTELATVFKQLTQSVFQLKEKFTKIEQCFYRVTESCQITAGHIAEIGSQLDQVVPKVFIILQKLFY